MASCLTNRFRGLAVLVRSYRVLCLLHDSVCQEQRGTDVRDFILPIETTDC